MTISLVYTGYSSFELATHGPTMPGWLIYLLFNRTHCAMSKCASGINCNNGVIGTFTVTIYYCTSLYLLQESATPPLRKLFSAEYQALE